MTKLCVTASTHPAKDKVLDYLKFLNDNNINIGYVHVDIMDGVFVEDKTFDHTTVREIYENTPFLLDVHLMVQNPEKVVDDYINAGANILTVHYEAFNDKNDLIKCLKYIKSKNCLAGISIKPATRISQIFDVLPLLDLVLIMSVEPGKSGQKFMKEAINRISSLVNEKKMGNLNFLIEVDGGLNGETAQYVSKLGIDMMVCGSALFNSTDKNWLINQMLK